MRWMTGKCVAHGLSTGLIGFKNLLVGSRVSTRCQTAFHYTEGDVITEALALREAQCIAPSVKPRSTCLCRPGHFEILLSSSGQDTCCATVRTLRV
jgi:hypothetical protein